MGGYILKSGEGGCITFIRNKYVCTHPSGFVRIYFIAHSESYEKDNKDVKGMWRPIRMKLCLLHLTESIQNKNIFSNLIVGPI